MVVRLGYILPSGIGTDEGTKFFFQDLVNTETICTFYDFENKRQLFPGVAPVMRFCLLTITGRERPIKTGGEFIFFAQSIEDLSEPDRKFTLTSEEIRLINPNTQTCPIFKTKREAEITKSIYAKNPILLKHQPPLNPWGRRSNSA